MTDQPVMPTYTDDGRRAAAQAREEAMRAPEGPGSPAEAVEAAWAAWRDSKQGAPLVRLR